MCSWRWSRDDAFVLFDGFCFVLFCFVLFCIELFASFVFSFAVGVHSIHMICLLVFNGNIAIAVSLFLNIDPCSSSM